MSRRHCLSPAGLALLVLLGIPISAAAQESRYLLTSGTSSGGGTASITIESFGDGPGEVPPGRDKVLTPIYNAHLTVQPGSTAQQTTYMLRDSVDVALPPEYVVSIVGPSANVVRIFRSFGTFTVLVSENIPSQDITVVSDNPLPALGPAALVALPAALTLLGLGALARRRRVALAGAGADLRARPPPGS